MSGGSGEDGGRKPPDLHQLRTVEAADRPSQPAIELSPSQIFAQCYHVGGVLGEAGAGIVYKASPAAARRGTATRAALVGRFN